jgi:hypothetical protein
MGWFYVGCRAKICTVSNNLERGKKMNGYTQWIMEAAGCSVAEAREIQDVIENEWLIEKWSRATDREIKRAVKQAQEILLTK